MVGLHALIQGTVGVGCQARLLPLQLPVKVIRLDLEKDNA